MKEIEAAQITAEVARLCIEANRKLPSDVLAALQRAQSSEPWEPAQVILGSLLENVDAASEMQIPICQDTGMACVFIEAGQDVHLTGGSLEEAVNEGVRRGYQDGYLRKSVVSDPLRRDNTRDNTPALLSTEIVPGDQLHITVLPKGFGSENMSRIAMLKPVDGREGVETFILETVRAAGPNPCPPIVVGVGIGGSFDKVALLAKKALLRRLDTPNPDPYYALMEQKLLAKINRTGIGPAGYGGQATALGVAIEVFPTHIAGLPVAINISCHATRRATVTL